MLPSVTPKIETLRRVLVIDDDPVSLSLTTLLLESEGVEVEQRASGESACHDPLPAGWHPDLILTDLQMPGVQGSALARQLALRWPEAPRIAMSAATPRAVEGYIAVLQKPLPLEGLRTTLENLCRSAQNTLKDASHAEIKPARNHPLAPLDKSVFLKLKSSMQIAALQEFLDAMLADAGKRIELIQHAMDAGDMAAAKREAHTLRGAAGMAGALALKEAARNLEVEVDSLDDLKHGLARLKAEYERVSVILASKLL
ncbi:MULTISPECIES: response regulator [Acidobacterium]|uniref:Two-component hybrid sensor and regulator, putative n=1 Tax=Acidobacterium capsulatum (strain ATCC 51196 / DSM 11244 / BCRC 80197 / JCM 7670 / NBRC 15755 / NCIMB 13165 / 161) TaxID=240015 RepID=C1F665_ACIC5|nr:MULTISPECIES: response regulator [Acidobacterium]ACO32183.1 two-component hybrid sensor and regulator, putative [Acidobacterium capsulatum ATCC 51196]HCT60862.1 response regulator [Acidobacterium sp.]